MLLEGLEPRARPGVLLRPARNYEQQVVRAGVRGERRERRAALLAGPRRRHADLQDSTLREQRQRPARGAELRPIEAAIRDKEVPPGEAFSAGARAYGVGGLAGQQRLVADDQPGGGEALLQRARDLVRVDAHG